MNDLHFENADVHYMENFILDDNIFTLISNMFEFEENKTVDNGDIKYKLNRKTMVFIDNTIDKKWFLKFGVIMLQ